MNLTNIAEHLINELAKEITNQGHRGTGKLINSLRHEIKQEGNDSYMRIFANYYAKFVANGVGASKIPYTRGSGKKTSKYIDALTNWVVEVLHKTPDAKARSIAFAIANAHKKQGMPTTNSYRYSNNGRRLNFIQYVLNENRAFIKEEIQKEYGKTIRAKISNIVKKQA